MRYHLLLTDPENPMGTPPCDDLGREVGPQESPRPWEVEYGTSSVPWDDNERDISTEKELLDQVCIGGVNLLFSCKAKMLLDDLVLGEELGFMRTRIINRKRKHLADYFMLYACAMQHVLDLESSDIEYYTPKKFMPPAGVFKWVILPDRLPRSDLFYSEAYKWVATQTLMDRFEANGVSGVLFIPIWSHEEGPLSHDPWARRMYRPRRRSGAGKR